MATYVTLTVNAEDIIGADFDPSRCSVWLETNTPDGLIVVDGTTVRLGGRRETPDATGVVTFANLVATNSASNPTSFGYRVRIIYVPKGSRKQGHDEVTTSDFELTASANLAAIPGAWDNVAIPPNWRSDFRTEMQAIKSATAAHRTAVENVIITDLGTTDGQTKTLIETDGTLTKAALSATLASKWRAATAYVAGDVRQAPDGSTIRRNTNGTSADTFTTTELAAPVLSAPTTATTGGTIAAGTTYFYKATALNALGETIGSTEVSLAIAAALTTPVNAAFTTATTGGTLAAGTYSYRVSATNAAGETLASTATTQTVAAALAAPVLAAPTTATTGGTLAAATYYYKATAINAVGETIGSNEVSIATTGTTSTVGLSWAAITGATGYKIYRATVAGGESTSPALVATLDAVTTYTDTGTAVSAGAVPATNTTATTTNTVTVNWGAVAGATGYKVYGRTDAGELLMASVGAVTTWTDTGAVTPAGALPASNTTATNTNTVGLSWAAITGATGYKIYRATATGGQSTSPALVASVGAVTTYTDTGTAVTAGAVPATGTTSEKAHWTAVAAVAGTMEQVALSATYGLGGDTPNRDAGDSRWSQQAKRPVNLMEAAPTIDWTGATDSAAAVQDALTTAGPGTPIDMGRGGRIRLDSGITMQAFQTLSGGVKQVGSGSSAPIELWFPGLTGSAIGITMGSSCELSRLLVRGPGYANAGTVGIKSANPTARLNGVQVHSWGNGIALDSVWYGVLDEVEMRHNAVALTVNNSYNLDLEDIQINGTNGAAYGKGVVTTGSCMFNLFGGSIEMTQVGVEMSGASILNMHGTYWETYAPNAVGVDAAGINGHQVNAIGCQVYLQNYDGWIDFQTVDSAVLNAGGNFFRASGSSTPAAPTAYKFDAALSASEVNLGVGRRDSWRQIGLSLPAALYTNRDGAIITGLSAIAPRGYTSSAHDSTMFKVGRSVRVPVGSVITTGSGTTASRPDASSVPQGSMWWDATLAKPIWSNGSTWRDANNTAV